jgi:hypothetical protein
VTATEPAYTEVIVVYSPLLLGCNVAALDGICTTTVPSWPSGPGRAKVVVMGTKPAYTDVIVVKDCGNPLPLDADIAAPDGNCTKTVPSWPSGPGKAIVVVRGTEPVYIELIVVKDCGNPLPLGAEIVAPDGTCTNTVPSCPSNPGKARVVVMGTEPV